MTEINPATGCNGQPKRAQLTALHCTAPHQTVDLIGQRPQLATIPHLGDGENRSTPYAET